MRINRILTSVFLLVLLTATVGFLLWHWSIWIFFIILMLFLSVKIYGSIFIDSNFYIQTKCHANRNRNAISITFDDGPKEINTERILDILKIKSIKATFFCIGKNMERLPSVTKRMDDEGHLIGNHSFEHGRFFDLQSASSMKEELSKTSSAIFKITSKKPKLFRPPYGITNPNLACAVNDGSYETIGWSIRSFDTISQNRNRLWKRITRNLKPGDIVLLHDYSDLTIELLPDFIDHVAAIGLKIVRLDELLNIKPYA